ncbi:DUF397 domain-containing protein [Streptomyces bacillaris]|uniref:DUF397 domain-containing protein n=1 Tax=Streptomyces bacillaris TaxID=68179 RepID=UPI00334B26D4
MEATAGRIPPEIPALLDQVFATDGLFQRLYEQIVAEGFSVYSRKRIELEPKAAVRDSKVPAGPSLALSRGAWAGLVRYAKATVV